jgi:1,4-alpha-glucan branching enzyme
MPVKTIGEFTFVLHTHLPYVLSHGRWPHGTDWLVEAASECYLPIANMLNDLVAEGIKPHITISISPVLCEQLAHQSFKDEFHDYLETKIQAAIKDKDTFSKHGKKSMAALAERWQHLYTNTKIHFEERYKYDLIGEFRRLQDEGYIEVMTCGATHGYMPLLSHDTTIQAQVKQAVQSYENHFGRKPRGIWLPECAYRPRYKWSPPVGSGIGKEAYGRKGVEEFLSENGIDYFVVDTALLKGGKAIGVYIDRFEALQKLWGQFEKEYEPRDEAEDRFPHQPYLVSSAVEGKKPVAIFTRDPDTGLQVWSGEHGYPGDGNYLDFHKKHFPGGHRYWSVTSAKSDLADKLEYNAETAMSRVPENAAHFCDLVGTILGEHNKNTSTKGILCAPYDTELFGHWWGEGVYFLKEVMRNIAKSPDIELTTCSKYLAENVPSRVISIPEGSWGEGGYHYIWLNEWTEWTWKHIYEDEAKMSELARQYKDTTDDKLRDILKQAARELMLEAASDWQFLISTWAARDYAEMRLSEHHEAFVRLANMADRYGSGAALDDSDWTYFGDIKNQDDIFPDIRIEWFAEVEFPA